MSLIRALGLGSGESRTGKAVGLTEGGLCLATMGPPNLRSLPTQHRERDAGSASHPPAEPLRSGCWYPPLLKKARAENRCIFKKEALKGVIISQVEMEKPCRAQPAPRGGTHSRRVAGGDPPPIAARWEGAARGWAPQFGRPPLGSPLQGRENLGTHGEASGAAECRGARRGSWLR